jgi:serralysin
MKTTQDSSILSKLASSVFYTNGHSCGYSCSCGYESSYEPSAAASIEQGLAPDASNDFTTKDFGKGTATANTVAAAEQNVNALLGTKQWKATNGVYNITFSFPNRFDTDYESRYESKFNPKLAIADSFKPFDFDQQTAGERILLNQFGAVSGLRPTRLRGSADRDATIRIAMYDVLTRDGSPGTAFGMYPGSGVQAGDIWFNRGDYNTPQLGNFAYVSYLHEIGHALGLKHGHEQGGIKNVALNFDRDSSEFSVMTYRSYIGHDATSSTNEEWGNPQSLMMYDIRALQQMYGANFGYNANDTTYSFVPTTGEMFVNGVGQGRPGGNRIFRTIWDGNGNDTYDFSNYTTNQVIDLSPGGWSDLANNSNAQRARLGPNNYARGHVFNALQYNDDPRSLIENAVGGSGNDLISGNRASNILNGRGGNDKIYNTTNNSSIGVRDVLLGDTGDDTIFDMDGIDGDYHDGGLGTDQIAYSNYNFGETQSVIDLITNRFTNGDKFEVIEKFENATGTQSADNIIGTSTSNILDGYSGNDIIEGREGDDDLSGGIGDDQLSGGEGANKLNGDAGNDLLFGFTGIDILNGGDNDDYLSGSLGNDVLTGGSGQDTFAFGSPNDGVDTITDFVVADDRLRISNSDFGGQFAGLTVITVDQFRIGATAQDNSDRFIYNQSTGALYFDRDGVGGVAQTQLATLSANLAMTNQDIHVLLGSPR